MCDKCDVGIACCGDDLIWSTGFSGSSGLHQNDLYQEKAFFKDNDPFQCSYGMFGDLIRHRSDNELINGGLS